MAQFRQLYAVLLHASLILCQFPPERENITVVHSKYHPGIHISYKQTGVCETTPGVKSYSGYVHLPPHALDEPEEDQDYPINTFFVFFEARKDPHNAPLAIWLNGGPGGSSMNGALAENGPCFVHNDSNSTYLNPWSWNNEVNLLYIDQPNGVGYSYDTLTNITASIGLEGFYSIHLQPADFSDGVPEQNLTFRVGTAGSQKLTHTANSTTHAATALWHFAQTWLDIFPHYKPRDEQISLFAESYGGHYGPGFVSFFMKQNELIKNGALSHRGAHYLHMTTLGIVNGCIDAETQFPFWATFANNNTYGIKVFNDSQYYRAMYELARPGGIMDLLQECRRLQRELDPNDHGDVERVSQVCQQADMATSNAITGQFFETAKYGWVDLTHEPMDSFPPAYSAGFLNQHWVQRELGVPVNHTYASFPVAAQFSATGDMLRGNLLEDIGYILDHGVRVAMMYGDRDYACNWAGGEAASLNVPYLYKDSFAAAGYTPLVLSPVHSAGLTRQHGNLSFTRVYQAGHMVPSYQPEAAYEIFMRAITGRDIATGKIDLEEFAAEGRQYATDGASDAWWMKSDILPGPPRECYIFDTSRCSGEEKEWIKDGTAIVKDWIVVGRSDETRNSDLEADEQHPMLDL